MDPLQKSDITPKLLAVAVAVAAAAAPQQRIGSCIDRRIVYLSTILSPSFCWYYLLSLLAQLSLLIITSSVGFTCPNHNHAIFLLETSAINYHGDSKSYKQQGSDPLIGVCLFPPLFSFSLFPPSGFPTLSHSPAAHRGILRVLLLCPVLTRLSPSRWVADVSALSTLFPFAHSFPLQFARVVYLFTHFFYFIIIIVFEHLRPMYQILTHACMITRAPFSEFKRACMIVWLHRQTFCLSLPFRHAHQSPRSPSQIAGTKQTSAKTTASNAYVSYPSPAARV